MEKPDNLTTTKMSGSSSCHAPGHSQHSWLGRHRGAVITVIVAAAATALALSQHWLAAATLLPLLYVLPCAVMMFMCMKGMNHGEQPAAPAPVRNETPTNSGA